MHVFAYAWSWFVARITRHFLNELRCRTRGHVWSHRYNLIGIYRCPYCERAKTGDPI